MKKVAVIMGSISDLETVRGAANTLNELDISFEMRVLSAHRTPSELTEFVKEAESGNFGVFIAAAGMAAHLAGAVAAQTTLPVIGLPLSSRVLDGQDALLSTVQMPPGIPVATVGINAAKNAALLAAEILAVSDRSLAAKLIHMRKVQHQSVLDADERIKTEAALIGSKEQTRE